MFQGGGSGCSAEKGGCRRGRPRSLQCQDGELTNSSGSRTGTIHLGDKKRGSRKDGGRTERSRGVKTLVLHVHAQVRREKRGLPRGKEVPAGEENSQRSRLFPKYRGIIRSF